MARKSPSRLELRKQVEAAEALEKTAPAKKKKKAAKRKTTTRAKRTKVKVVVKKRLVWGVFSSSLKEEARFPYDQRKEADKKRDQLQARGKRTYFVQPIKEPLPEPEPQEES